MKIFVMILSVSMLIVSCDLINATINADHNSDTNTDHHDGDNGDHDGDNGSDKTLVGTYRLVATLAGTAITDDMINRTGDLGTFIHWANILITVEADGYVEFDIFTAGITNSGSRAPLGKFPTADGQGSHRTTIRSDLPISLTEATALDTIFTDTAKRDILYLYRDKGRRGLVGSLTDLSSIELKVLKFTGNPGSDPITNYYVSSYDKTQVTKTSH
ncbi:hypothetical protein P0082_10330 [Candidatus Haliotispira prima]|uniref:Uncharacterized protein n=1 Tax=Candidatus Haliotispira prima TaxID=3034016 RepID=A0ABY8MFU4_9SPIO|nr:hypothetical protein P0082_10330 [Candidatus Haliotispira prima]